MNQVEDVRISLLTFRFAQAATKKLLECVNVKQK